MIKLSTLPRLAFDQKGWSLLFDWLYTLYSIVSQTQPISYSVASTSAVAVTIFTIPSGFPATWAVSCSLGTQNDTVNYSAFAIIQSDGTSARIAFQNNAVKQTITLSGLAVQSTQSSGSSQTIYSAVARLA